MAPDVLVIGGPTASGKTAAAIALCRGIGGEVVSADSMQIYRGMDIGTAKPSKEEQGGVPHHMLDLVDPGTSFSVADYAAAARRCLRDILGRGRVPVVCGGTGQYISAILQGLEFPTAPADALVRERLAREWEQMGPQAMHDRLSGIDPASAARIHPNDRKRVVRALEVFETTGGTLTEMNRQSRQTPPAFTFGVHLLRMEREALYRRCDLRVERMLQDGLVDEVRSLLRAGLPLSSTAMQAIGYKEIAEHLSGVCSLDSAVERIRRATRNYAKRQLTWFRSIAEADWIDVDRLDPPFDPGQVARIIREISESSSVPC